MTSCIDSKKQQQLKLSAIAAYNNNPDDRAKVKEFQLETTSADHFLP